MVASRRAVSRSRRAESTAAVTELSQALTSWPGVTRGAPSQVARRAAGVRSSNGATRRCGRTPTAAVSPCAESTRGSATRQPSAMRRRITLE